MVYLQSFQNDVVKTNIIRCCQVERGTASCILKAIATSVVTVMEMPDFLSKQVAVGSEGTSVMLGCNAGVFVLLKERKPAIIAVHFCGHHLELACKDTVKNTICQKVVTLLGGLYYMYHNSPLNRTNIKNAYQCLNMIVWQPAIAGGTRWTGHVLLALDKFISGYSALRLHLEQVNTNTSEVIQFIFISVISITKEMFPF